MLRKNVVPQAVLENAKIPAVSAAWYQDNTMHLLTGGVSDQSNPKLVDEFTLFQAASLSKPVSAAIVLDLVEQGQWDLDKPLAQIAAFGSADMRKDPNYEELTTRMIIGQASGLPNWFESGSKETFIAKPDSYFIYSGVAFQCLKDVIEEKTGKTSETLAQEFFKKARMEHSTFKQPIATHLKESIVAR
ncbi:MAG: serine hydrolase domain-containing protein [Gammaproteobacteria bacterium]